MRGTAFPSQNVHMRQEFRRRDRGFTLVELMIVVGVIGVIASLAIPNYLRFTARSSRSEMLETRSFPCKDAGERGTSDPSPSSIPV